MGQKVNPHGLRVGIIKDWQTQWYATKKDFGKYLLEDYKIRECLYAKYKDCGISEILIQRLAGGKLVVNILTSRPGMLIGQKGSGVEEMKKLLSKVAVDKAISINIMEIKRPDLDAQLVSENIAAQLEKRASWRRTMKQSISRTMKTGAKGVKVMLSGRLDGAEIARCEQYHEGSIPLQTLRADIDYGFAEAHTTFGKIGVKVWINKGEVFAKPKGGDNNANA